MADEDEIGDGAAGILGSVMAVQGDLGPRAITLLKRGEAQEPDARAWLGVVHLRLGETRRGVALLEAALAEASSQAAIKLGNHYLEEGRLKDAERAYRVGVDGGELFAIYNLGKMIHENFPRRRREALQLIRAAANRGDVVAKAWLRAH
jgi:tetratricopeptide (TPR) repeat protein